MSFGQLFVLSPSTSHIFFAPPQFFYKTRPVLFMNKVLGTMKAKNCLLQPRNKEFLSWKNKISLTSSLTMLRIRNRIILVSRIRISIRVKSRIRIRMAVNIRIRIQSASKSKKVTDRQHFPQALNSRSALIYLVKVEG